MDVNFEMSYGIVAHAVVDDMDGDGRDVLILFSPEADEACEQYDPRLKIPEKKGLN